MLADAATVGLLFFLGFIGLGIAIMAVLRYWLVEGTLEAGPALGALGLVLLGSAWVVKSGSPLWMLFWVVALIGGSLVLPALADLGDKRAMREILEDDLAKYQRAIERDAKNASAWREMAELYLKMNRYDEAIAAYKEAIKLEPHDVGRIRRRLNQALDYRAGLPNAATVVCAECKTETPKGKACANCGAPLEMNFLEWLFHAQNLREVLGPTAGITAGIIALLAVFSALPIGLKAAVILACVAAGGFFIWRAVQDGD